MDSIKSMKVWFFCFVTKYFRMFFSMKLSCFWDNIKPATRYIRQMYVICSKQNLLFLVVFRCQTSEGRLLSLTKLTDDDDKFVCKNPTTATSKESTLVRSTVRFSDVRKGTLVFLFWSEDGSLCGSVDRNCFTSVLFLLCPMFQRDFHTNA